MKKVLRMRFLKKCEAFSTAAGLVSVSIIVLLFTYCSNRLPEETTLLKEKLNFVESKIVSRINDTAALQKVKEEYVIKFTGMEKILKNPNTGDKKVRDDALKSFRDGDYSKARKLFEEKRNKEKEKKHAQTTYRLGEIAFLELDFEGALAYYLEVEHLEPDNTSCQNNIGLIYYVLNKYKKAIEYYEKALSSDLKTYGSEHPDVATRWNNLGSAWQMLGQYEKAIEYLEKAFNFFEAFLGNDHPDTKSAKKNLEIVRRKLK